MKMGNHPLVVDHGSRRVLEITLDQGREAREEEEVEVEVEVEVEEASGLPEKSKVERKENK
jgi:hypothetical protein